MQLGHDDQKFASLRGRDFYFVLIAYAIAQIKLHICAISPEPLLIMHTKEGFKGRLKPKFRLLAPLESVHARLE